MRAIGLWVGALILGCHGASDDDAARRQCQDVSAQIEQAFLDYTESGNLLPGQQPCQLTADSLDPRVSRETVDRVLGQFANACDIQADACAGIDRELPDQEQAPQSVSGPPTAPPPYIQQSERAAAR
jgi:hypothetical protein